MGFGGRRLRMAKRTERTDGFERFNERGRRGMILSAERWIMMVLAILYTFFVFKSIALSHRIEKAKDLLGDDPQGIATPARLYNVLSGNDDLVPQTSDGKPQ